METISNHQLVYHVSPDSGHLCHPFTEETRLRTMEAAERRKAHETHLALSMTQMRGKEMTSLDMRTVVVKGGR